ncbi:MAG TPA: hypothetical protein VM432_02755 [Bdellovibrionales bacterium]|nr:hypothetical protein [Bdellovibrionales bacterium]
MSAEPRVILANLLRKGATTDQVEIHSHTKHGDTSLMSVKSNNPLVKGDVLKTKEWLFSSREFIIIGPHSKPMKIAGDWYEVKVVKMPVAKPGPKPKSRK